MTRTSLLFIALMSSTLAAQSPPKTVEASRCHVYIDQSNIWTLEMVQDGVKLVPILNIITLNEEDDETPLRPAQIQISRAKGKPAKVDRFSIDTGVDGDPYVTDFLTVLANSFIGMDLIGNFEGYDEPATVTIELGEDEFTLAPIECLDYETLAQKIDKINFNSPNVKEDFAVLEIPMLGTKGQRKSGRR